MKYFLARKARTTVVHNIRVYDFKSIILRKRQIQNNIHGVIPINEVKG